MFIPVLIPISDCICQIKTRKHLLLGEINFPFDIGSKLDFEKGL
jgi:hypothetical protein